MLLLIEYFARWKKVNIKMWGRQINMLAVMAMLVCQLVHHFGLD